MNNNGSGKQFRGIIIYVLVIAAVFAAIYFMTSARPANDNYTFSEFQKDLNDEVISQITITQIKEVRGRGFTAVMVSWMSHFNPFTMILTSFLLVFLNRGASEIATAFSLNTSFSDILTGIIIFFIIGCEFFIRYQISFRSSAKKKEG